MDFKLDEAQQAVRDMARKFAQSTLAPLRPRDRPEPHLPDAALKELAALGLLGVNVAGDATAAPRRARWPTPPP